MNICAHISLIGGRFKKEISVEGCGSFLMMIRDEAGSPEWQFAQWVDAVLLVFSLENEGSFQVSHRRNRSCKVN